MYALPGIIISRPALPNDAKLTFDPKKLLVASAYEEQFRAQAKSSVVRRKEDYLIRQYFPYLKAEISIPADNYIDAFERGGEQLNQYAHTKIFFAFGLRRRGGFFWSTASLGLHAYHIRFCF